MNVLKFFLVPLFVLSIVGCASTTCNPFVGEVLQGTDTAIVGLYIDKNGYPQSNVHSVLLYPGQKIIFAGPNQFDIFFKDNKTPVDAMEIKSSRGVVTLTIPLDVFDKIKRESKTDGIPDELKFKYGIRANGKVTDPEIVIRRR